jgi:hypothetical protein
MALRAEDGNGETFHGPHFCSSCMFYDGSAAGRLANRGVGIFSVSGIGDEKGLNRVVRPRSRKLYVHIDGGRWGGYVMIS